MINPQSQLLATCRAAQTPDRGECGPDTLRWASFRRAIESAVSLVFAIDETEIRSATRGCARAALARQAAMYLAHVALSLSFRDVGRLFCRDRTTVAHGCALVEDRRDDPCFDRTMELLEIVACTLMTAHGPARPRMH